MSSDNIKIQELTRNTAAGRFVYAIYKGKVARRPARRGRPHYDIVPNITIGSGDKPIEREISAESQLGRLLTA